MRPWPRSRVRSSTGTRCQGKALAAVQQGGLVGLDHEQVVRLLAGDQELGGLGVGLEGVGGDHDAGEVQWGQQRGEGGDLLGRAADLVLGQHRAAGVVHRRQQVHRAAVAVWWVGAAQRLAVDRHRPPPAGSAGPGPRSRSASQAPTATASASTSRRARVRRMVASAGTPGGRGRRGGRRARPGRAGRVGGPLGDRGDRARPGQHRSGRQGQDRDQWVAAATGSRGSGTLAR